MGDSLNDADGAIDLPSCIQSPELSGKWYLFDLPEKGVYECRRECAGRNPCNGRAPLHKKLFSTFEEVSGFESRRFR